MEPNGWKYKALNLASVSIVRWGVSTYTHVFLDVVVCSGLQYKLYILTACCSPKNFEKKSSLELIFWMSVNFPAWLPFYFEQGLDFLILFLSCNRISQPRHYWHMGLITFWCVLWRWGSVRCRLFSSILSPQDARSTFPPAETAKHVSRGCQEPCKGQNHPQLRTIPYGAPNNSPLQQKIDLITAMEEIRLFCHAVREPSPQGEATCCIPANSSSCSPSWQPTSLST